MTEREVGLFELEDATPEKVAERTPLPIRDEQVAELREAFASAGITSMEERKAVIESCVLRPVASVRELRARDVRGILDRIRARAGNSSGSVTSWSDRTQDTWIDKL